MAKSDNSTIIILGIVAGVGIYLLTRPKAPGLDLYKPPGGGGTGTGTGTGTGSGGGTYTFTRTDVVPDLQVTTDTDTSPTVNVRQAPSSDAPLIGTVPRGTRIWINARTSDGGTVTRGGTTNRNWIRLRGEQNGTSLGAGWIAALYAV
jgi:hypothetical protein